MNMQFPGIITIAFLAMIPDMCNAQSVEQRDYSFKMEITQDVKTETFLIGEFSAVKHPRPPAAVTAGVKNKRQLTLRMSQAQNTNQSIKAAVVLFDLASSQLPQEEKEKIIMSLQHKISKSMALTVTGFTCDLGSQAANDRLAQQRADVVGKLLKENGYHVSTVTGKGRQGYITDNPQMRHLNRRVEIRIDKSNNQEQ